MPVERELKIIGADFDELRRALQQEGAKFQARFFERNAVLDDEGGSLRNRGMLLRLRQGQDGSLTLKLPVRKEKNSVFKEMEERETSVGDFDATLLILDGLGLRPAFWYEKIRERWRLGRVEIDLDVLPFGRFVEIEGPAEAIGETVARLGLASLETSSASYHELHREYRLRQGSPAKDGFAFVPGEAQRILSDEGI